MEGLDVEKVFYARAEKDKLQTLIENTLHGADGGELFLELCHSESISIEDGIIKSADFNFRKGFGLRAYADGVVSMVCSSEICDEEIREAASIVQCTRKGTGGVVTLNANSGAGRRLYGADSPVSEIPFVGKVEILQNVDAYCRSVNPNVVQVKASINTQWQVVQIIRCDGSTIGDVRPLVRFDVYVLVEKGGRKEHGRGGLGGRDLCSKFLMGERWKSAADEALRQSGVNLESVAAPAGEITVVLGPGFPGVLLHEAVGHGLESDFNRKKVSAFSDAMGKKVAAKGITVVDDGTMRGKRGSLNVDDEGTASGYNVLIEDGVLVSYMHDNMNSQIMGVKSTGNGRRESYRSMVMPRMTNTYMLPGEYSPQEIISSVRRGIYAADFGGGQVDITSGQFVFSASESYMIENGKIGQPLKGATLVGSGPDILHRVSMVGSDLALDAGTGTCSKNGQSIPVCVGQPTLKIDLITVGGTALGA